MSLWGEAPELVKRLLAAVPPNYRMLHADARAWLEEANSTPRYDQRVAAMLDSELQRLAVAAVETSGPPRESIERTMLKVRAVLDDVLAGRWPRPETSGVCPMCGRRGCPAMARFPHGLFVKPELPPVVRWPVDPPVCEVCGHATVDNCATMDDLLTCRFVSIKVRSGAR